MLIVLRNTVAAIQLSDYIAHILVRVSSIAHILVRVSSIVQGICHHLRSHWSPIHFFSRVTYFYSSNFFITSWVRILHLFGSIVFLGSDCCTDFTQNIVTGLHYFLSSIDNFSNSYFCLL